MKLLTLIGKSWKTHPEFFPKFQFRGHEVDRITGKLVQKSACVMTHVPKFLNRRLDEFSSNNGLAHARKFANKGEYSDRMVLPTAGKCFEFN